MTDTEDGVLVAFDGTNGRIRDSTGKELPVTIHTFDGSPSVGLRVQFVRHPMPDRPVLRAWVHPDQPAARPSFEESLPRPDRAEQARASTSAAPPTPSNIPYLPAAPPPAPLRARPRRESAPASAPPVQADPSSLPATAASASTRPRPPQAREQPLLVEQATLPPAQAPRSLVPAQPAGWGQSLQETAQHVVQLLQAHGRPMDDLVTVELNGRLPPGLARLRRNNRPAQPTVVLSRHLRSPGASLDLAPNGDPVSTDRVRAWAASLDPRTPLRDQGLAISASGLVYGWDRRVAAGEVGAVRSRIWPVPVRHVNDQAGRLVPAPSTAVSAQALASAAAFLLV